MSGAIDERSLQSAVAAPNAFSIFLQLERAARHAQTQEALQFVMVNETRRLLNYRQAALTLITAPARSDVAAVAGVAVLDRTAPFLLWLEAVLASIAQSDRAGALHVLDPAALPSLQREEWAEWSAPHALWIPLAGREGNLIAALWLAREEPWSEGDQLLANQLADAYAHALHALLKPKLSHRIAFNRRHVAAAIVAAIVVLALPVAQTALAPAEVIAETPLLVAAPIDGVISAFAVEPNQPVKAGQELFRFDDTNLRSQRDVAQRTLEVAQADLHRATQGAFDDATASAQVELLRAQVALRQTELDYAEAMFARLTVKAERAGIAVFADPQQWIGRPVKTGERILQIADPKHAALRVDLHVGQALALQPGARITLFLDNNPLHALNAKLIRSSYEAEALPDNTLAYRLDAAFTDGDVPRIGFRGTAKVYGERAPLFLYLFRRPLSALRQMLGF